MPWKPTGTSGNPTDSVYADLVNTEELDIGGSDFASSGDYIPQYTFGPNANRQLSFTNTGYDNDGDLSRIHVEWDKLFPSDVQSAVFGEIFISTVGTDETIDVRVFNGVDGETVAEQTGITTTGLISLGPVNYEPLTTTDRIALRWEWRESNGANPSEVRIPYIVLGAQL
jgi:hypothetical protein